MRGRRALIKGTVTILAVLALAGGALAYFTSTGSGAASGDTSISLSGVTVTGTTGTESLLPTGTATGDINLTLTNPNSSSVHINSLALDTGQGVGGFSANAGSCALSFATQTNGGNGWTISDGGSLPLDLTGSVTMGTSAASSCQGQTFTVHLRAS